MAGIDYKRNVLKGFLDQYRRSLPRPSLDFLNGLLNDEVLLDRMWFCRSDERLSLRDSVQISAVGPVPWAVALGSRPAQNKAKLALDGLSLRPSYVLDRLRLVPIWFLALEPMSEPIVPGEAAMAERTSYSLYELSTPAIRRASLMDQIDAALDAGDREAYERIRSLLLEVIP